MITVIVIARANSSDKIQCFQAIAVASDTTTAE